jgi:ribosomal protein L15
MPRGDGTGPAGAGPMSGKGAGYCAGYDEPGYTTGGGWGRGFGRGRGRGCGYAGGRGRRNIFYAAGLPGWMRFGRAGAAPGRDVSATTDPEMDKKALRNQAEALQAELDLINKRLDELA